MNLPRQSESISNVHTRFLLPGKNFILEKTLRFKGLLCQVREITSLYRGRLGSKRRIILGKRGQQQKCDSCLLLMKHFDPSKEEFWMCRTKDHIKRGCFTFGRYESSDVTQKLSSSFQANHSACASFSHCW